MMPEQTEKLLEGIEPVAYAVYAILGGKSAIASAEVITAKNADGEWRSDSGLHGDYWSGNEPLYTKESLVKVAAAARKAALEEAALVCDNLASDKYDQYKGRGKHSPGNPQLADTYTNGESDGAGECAHQIRQLNQV